MGGGEVVLLRHPDTWSCGQALPPASACSLDGGVLVHDACVKPVDLEPPTVQSDVASARLASDLLTDRLGEVAVEAGRALLAQGDLEARDTVQVRCSLAAFAKSAVRLSEEEESYGLMGAPLAPRPMSHGLTPARPDRAKGEADRPLSYGIDVEKLPAWGSSPLLGKIRRGVEILDIARLPPGKGRLRMSLGSETVVVGSSAGKRIVLYAASPENCKDALETMGCDPESIAISCGGWVGG